MPPRDTYVPVPTEKPEQVRGEIATPSVHINFPDVEISGAVGKALAQLGEQGYGTLSRATAHVGAAFDSLGRSLEKAGDQVWNRAIGLQELENETLRNKATVEFEHYASEKKLELEQKQGANATADTLKMYNEDLEKKRQELRARLPMAEQKKFDPVSTGVAGRAGIAAAGHIAKEIKSSALGASNARVDMAVKGITEAETTKEAMEHYNTIRNEVYGTAGPIQGWTREEMDRAIALKAENGFGSMLNRISRTDPKLANEMFEANKGVFISPGKEEQVRHTMQENELRYYTRAIASRAHNENPDATLEEKLSKGDRMAEEVKDQPMLKGDVEREIRTQHRTHNEEVNEVRKQSLDKIKEGMDGVKVPGGKMPRNEDELFAQGPEYREAWAHLTEGQKIEARRGMAKIAVGDIPPSDDTIRRRVALDGIYTDNPELFRDINLHSELGKITLKDYKELRRFQRELVKQGHNLEADPKMQQHLTQLAGAGVLPKTMHRGSASWNEFVGVFRQGIKGAEEDLKYSRPLKEEEVVRIGKMALEKVGGWWGIGQHYHYKDIIEQSAKIPDNFRARILQLNPDITEPEMVEQYQRTLMQLEYKQRYGPKKPKGAAGAQ